MDDAIDIRLVVESDIATTQLVQQILKACEAYNIRTVKSRLDELTISDFSPPTIPLFVRCADPFAQAWTDTLSAAGRTYAYYIDDNFWRIAGDTTLAAYYRNAIVRTSLEKNVTGAQAVITNSPELAQFVSRFNSHVVVLPTFFDFSLLDGSSPRSSSHAEIRIGFAGSPSRLDDLDLITPIIPTILAQFPTVVFEFVGAFPKGVVEGHRVRRFAHQADYSEYVRWQQQRGWLIGLAPLLDHEANRSKTDNKYREYAAFGYAGIYSAIPPYTNVVQHGETGLLVGDTTEEWLDAITLLLTQHGRRAAIAARAFEDVRSRYDIAKVSEQWARQLQALAAQQPLHVKPIDVPQLRRRLRKAFVDRWRVHISLRYHEGGTRLVAVKAAQMIARRLRQLAARV